MISVIVLLISQTLSRSHPLREPRHAEDPSSPCRSIVTLPIFAADSGLTHTVFSLPNLHRAGLPNDDR
jgi:hypothetical protein